MTTNPKLPGREKRKINNENILKKKRKPIDTYYFGVLLAH